MKANSVLVGSAVLNRASRSKRPSLAGVGIRPRATAMFVAKAIHAAHERLFHATSMEEFQFLKRELDRMRSSSGRKPESLSPALQEWATNWFRKTGALPDQRAADTSDPRHAAKLSVPRNQQKASNSVAAATRSDGFAKGKTVPIALGSSTNSKTL